MPDARDEQPAALPSVLTVSEVAAVLRVSRMTVYRLLEEGTLSCFRVGRSYRVHTESVQALLRVDRDTTDCEP